MPDRHAIDGRRRPDRRPADHRRGLPADLDVLFFGGIAKAAPLLRALRTAGRSQLFASGDGCWDLKGFVQKAQGAATSGAGVQILSAASSVGRLPGSADFAAGDQARYRPNLAAIETATRQAGGLPTHARVLVALQASHFQGIAGARPVTWDAKGDPTAAVIFRTRSRGISSRRWGGADLAH